MPKGDPRGGRPRRIDRSTEDILRAGLVAHHLSPRRVLPVLVPELVANRDRMLLQRPDPPPGHTSASWRSLVERDLAQAAVAAMRAAEALDDPKARDGMHDWLRRPKGG
jgi:hypothetical protein